jgi:hypothetical protein
MADLNKTFLYRMTHIQNIPHILDKGITHVRSLNANPNYKPIGDPSLISTRSNFVLLNNKKLGDYIPFYFGVLTPMLYVIQKGYNQVIDTPSEDIVYCVTSVQQIINSELDFVFTNGHAIDTLSSQYGSKDAENIDGLLDFKAIKDWNFKDPNDLDKKRRKQAEFLVDGDISVAAILGYVVYNQIAKDKLLSFGIGDNKVKIKKEYYF